MGNVLSGNRGFRQVAPHFLCALIVSSVTTAAVDVHPICPLVLHQEQVNREERELAVDLAVSHLAASESIFTLVDQLWKDDAVERMVYLTVKHDHEVAEIEVRRQRLLLKRQEAVVEQYTSVCSPAGAEETAAGRPARLDEARRLYLQVDCHRIGKDLAIAEVDLTYLSELLASVRDLRKHEVATRLDVIRAERDLEMARKRVDHQGRRVQECVKSSIGRPRPEGGDE